MSQHKFVAIVKYFPQIWDRSHPQFRDKEAKDCAWEIVGTKMGCSGDTCKETFKSLREKYIREREKSIQYGENYREWDLLPELKFLDPNIVPRKQSTSNDDDIKRVEEFHSKINLDTSFVSVNQTDFDKALILLVKKTTPIWDRNCNTYPNKQLKNQLWQSIAAKLNKDMNPCMLRWKALREKYIRQKTKYQQEGEVKWELLDEMSFLDKVIQYRRKHSDGDFDNKRMTYGENMHNNLRALLPRQNEGSQESDSNYSINPYSYETGDENSLNDSSNDYNQTVIKQENTVFQLADSSYCSGEQTTSRKRSTSINSESSAEKKTKTEETEQKEKTPEQLFGDLVAVMLSKKPEKDRNLYMIEIMTVLSK